VTVTQPGRHRPDRVPAAGFTAPAGRRPRRRSRRILFVLAVVLAAVVAGGAGVLVAVAGKLNANITRQDAFAGLPSRQRAVINGPLNILVVGSDSRNTAKPNFSGRPNSAQQDQRTDTILLMHIPADHKKAYLVSIPRDTFVTVPPYGSSPGGKAKINSAFSDGGVPLLVQTVQDFTGLTVDHVVVVDFSGFKNMVDALGGVDVRIDQATYDPETKQRFAAGVNHLDGTRALFFVRQRYGLPASDFDRMKRQQRFLYAMLAKATSTGTLTNPAKLRGFLDAATKSITVDQGLPVVDIAYEFKGLRPADLSFLTTPIAADGVDPTWGDILLADTAKATELFTAMRDDTMAAYVTANPPNNPLTGS